MFKLFCYSFVLLPLFCIEARIDKREQGFNRYENHNFNPRAYYNRYDQNRWNNKPYNIDRIEGQAIIDGELINNPYNPDVQYTQPGSTDNFEQVFEENDQ